MKDTFNYIAPFMGELVIITVKTPTVERINQFYAEQRKIYRDGGADSETAANNHRSKFFDEIYQSAQVSQGSEKVPYDQPLLVQWKENCIFQAFEKVGQIKN